MHSGTPACALAAGAPPPAGAARITILPADQLDGVQAAGKALRSLAIV